jgi:hypothetical protein
VREKARRIGRMIGEMDEYEKQIKYRRGRTQSFIYLMALAENQDLAYFGPITSIVG